MNLPYRLQGTHTCAASRPGSSIGGEFSRISVPFRAGTQATHDGEQFERSKQDPSSQEIHDSVIIPSRSTRATQASGLVFIDPKHALQARRHVHTANEIVEVHENEKFMIVLSNFSKTSRKLPKNMVIAYATRNPLEICALDDKTSEKFERVLHIPFTRK